MRKFTLVTITLLMLMNVRLLAQQAAQAQRQNSNEDYGNTLNLGVGLGYYDYVGHSIGVFHADYELNVARAFTLAPFIDYYTFQDNNYYANQNYYYRETVIPIGIKGTYYFDRLLHSNPNWDFYLAASLGFIIRNTTWQAGYEGNTTVNNGSGAIYLDLHAGAEYHMSRRVGIYLDLSTGVSTIGLAIHRR